MPYISPDDRKNYDAIVKELVDDLYHSGEAWKVISIHH